MAKCVSLGKLVFVQKKLNRKKELGFRSSQISETNQQKNKENKPPSLKLSQSSSNLTKSNVVTCRHDDADMIFLPAKNISYIQDFCTCRKRLIKTKKEFDF